MSDHNGNGSNGNGNGNGKTAGITVHGKPFQNGNDPRRGHGLKGRSGRPPSEVREKLRGAAWKRIKELERIADAAANDGDRLRALDLMFRYGLGTTVTETDTQGNDVIRVIREPRALHVDR